MNLKTFKRKPINLSQEKLIKTDFLKPEQHLPLLVEPLVDGIDLAVWATSNLEWIETQILNYGGILFRNFNINKVNGFKHFIQTISENLIGYSYRSTPRSQISGNIYTSTEYPADLSIPLLNEMANSRN